MSFRVEELNDRNFSDLADGEKLPPVTPGEIIREEFLLPFGITPYRLAKEIGVQQRRIDEILSGRRCITVDTGLRLSRFFGMNEEFFTGLQLDYDTAVARERMAETLVGIQRFRQAA